MLFSDRTMYVAVYLRMQSNPASGRQQEQTSCMHTVLRSVSPLPPSCKGCWEPSLICNILGLFPGSIPKVDTLSSFSLTLKLPTLGNRDNPFPGILMKTKY